MLDVGITVCFSADAFELILIVLRALSLSVLDTPVIFHRIKIFWPVLRLWSIMRHITITVDI